MKKATADRTGPRPGGRSARVQAAVHRAVLELQADAGEAELTVPAIAVQAGVTPSTIYRRWGTLSQLLSDVALENLRPEKAPEDTGSLESDLTLWLEQYLEEMASAPGRAMIRDVLRETLPGNASQCSAFTYAQIEHIHARALERGETPPPAEVLLERVIAPLMYRILFTPTPPTAEEARRLLDEVLKMSVAAYERT
jgi:AcrR family transcriptional regulator